MEGRGAVLLARQVKPPTHPPPSLELQLVPHLTTYFKAKLRHVLNSVQTGFSLRDEELANANVLFSVSRVKCFLKNDRKQGLVEKHSVFDMYASPSSSPAEICLGLAPQRSFPIPHVDVVVWRSSLQHYQTSVQAGGGSGVQKESISYASSL